jgi:formylglycine-generating enzyme required for sulfatase activity
MNSKLSGICMLVVSLVLISCPDPITPPTDQTISLLAIPGVIAPAKGAIPVTTEIATEQYTGTISWDPSANTFVADTVYTANLVLTAKAGFTLTGVAANSYTVAGAAVSHAVNSGTVVAVFPKTGSATEQPIAFVEVPSGTFQRDATETNTSTVSAFKMSKYEITRAQFYDVFSIDPSDTATSSSTNDPVQNVNWYQAAAFCNKLSILEGLAQVYGLPGVDFNALNFSEVPTVDNPTWNSMSADWTASGYRLPTEMEWMWAAMGATSGSGYVDGTYTNGYNKLFSGSTGSNFIVDYVVFGANTTEDGRTLTARTNPVGSKLDNELGLYDMSGNVWEWCWDIHGVLPSGHVFNYTGAESGPNRLVHGGGWFGSSAYVTIRNRDFGGWPYRITNTFGFRVVKRQ